MISTSDYLSIVLESFIIYQCLFSIIYLSSFRWKNNKWLIVTFFTLGWTIFNLQGSSHRFGFFIHPAFNNPAMVLLSFPCLYFYTKNLVGLKILSKWSQYLHFVPFLFFYIIFLVENFPPPEQFELSKLSILAQAFIASSFLISIIYTYWSYQLIALNQKKYKTEYASTNLFITLSWIKWTNLIILIFAFFNLFFLLYIQFVNPFPVKWINQFTLLLFVFVLSYFSFRQPTLYKPNLNTNPILPEHNEEFTSKYDRIISSEKKLALITQLEQYMENERPFLDPRIRMPELAQSLGISTNVFSYLINDHFKKNFFSFINEYRINHAIALLKDENFKHYSYESISSMCGFQSKSNFYRQFKAIVGKSPGEFQKESN